MTQTDRDPNDETGETGNTQDTAADGTSSASRRGRTRRGRRGGRGRGGSSDAPATGDDAASASTDADGEDGSAGGRRRRGRRGRGGRGRGGAASAEASSTTSSSEQAVPAPTGDDAPGERGATDEPAAGSAEATAGPDDEASDDGGARDDAAPAAGAPDGGGSTEDREDAGERGSARGAASADGRTRERTERSRSRSRTSSSTSERSRSRSGGSGRSQSSQRSGGSRGAGGSGRGGGAGTKAASRSEDPSDQARSSDDDAVEQAIAKGGTRMAAKKGNRRGNGNGGGNRRGNQQRPGGVPEEVRRAILEGPPRTMLVTAREDRTQISVLEDRTVVEHYVTRKEDVTYVGNIYMARVQNVLPGMEAAFLDIGKGRNGVLYAGEVLYDELDLEEGADQRIENVLKPGQKVLVQVTKDPMGTKGPRLTMHLSLAGRYVVLAPNSDLFGISRKLTDRERDRLRRIVKKVKPSEHGVIVRTAAEGASDDQLIADMERLLAKWAKVEKAAADAKALTAVYEEPPLVVKVIRDNFGPEFERCTVDDEDLYQQVRGYLEEVAEELLDKVELYGAPTADARARAAGAPPLSDDATGGGTTRDGDGAPAPDERAEPEPEERTAGSDDGTAGEPDDGADAAGEADDGADAAGGTADGAAPDDRDDDGKPGTDPEGTDPDGTDEARADGASAATGGVDLAAAAARRESLPPLFDAYDVTDQLRKAMGRKVWLPSGGYLIIETTEAMKVIDVNTGKFTGGKDTNLEEVVLKTNLEAADEIVRQLRLRDIGGIIVIDFIDMLLKANQDQVVRRLKRELLRDRTKTRVSEVSRLGLVQMTRKNVSQGLVESFSHTCEACEGRGSIPELD